MATLPPPLPPLPPSPAPPSGDALALLSALSDPAHTPHDRHAAALSARDRALNSSRDSYSRLCSDFARTLCCADPGSVSEAEWGKAASAAGGGDAESVARLRGGGAPWLHLRQMAGLLVKNALSIPPPGPDDGGDETGGTMRLTDGASAEVKACLMRSVADADGAIRRVASSAVSASCVGSQSGDGMESLPLPRWPELLPFLLGCLEAGMSAEGALLRPEVAAAVDGSLLTLRKVLEDAPAQFERESGPAFGRLVPTLLGTLRCQDAKVRREGLRCLNCLVQTMPGGLVVHMNDYLGGLSALATDHDESVRRLVCQAIVSMLSLRTEYLRPHFPSIAAFMLNATSDSDPGVALEACEFWLTFASIGPDDAEYDETTTGGQATVEMAETVRGLLPRLVPTLIRGMVYPEERKEELLEQNALDESSAADRAQDVAPVFHVGKSKGQQGDGGGRGGGGGEDDEDESDTDDDFEDDVEWSLRKCSAASLDTLASMFGADDLLPPLLPALQECLSHADPWVREAGVLALGAVADGCSDAMAPHMGQLHPFLLGQLADPAGLPQLKSIAAWTLGRYAPWAVNQVHAGQPDIVGKMTEALMSRALDANRRVQVAACSAFGVLVEATGDLMVPYLEPVYRTLARALSVYQTRSLMVLFDTLGTMADFIGPAIGEMGLPAIYVPPLLHMWGEIAKRNPFDRTILPLMESLASIALVAGMNFQPWALETFEGCMTVIETVNMMIASEGDECDDDEADPMVCAEDLIDGMVEGLGANFAALVASSRRYGDHFLQVLVGLAGHDVAGVRMSAFAVLGDLARQAPSVIEPGFGEVLTEAVACMDPMHPSVCNNAVWAVGEICVRCGSNPDPLRPYAGDALHNLISLLMGNAVDAHGNVAAIPGLAENAAACMGRLAKVCPEFVSGDLPRFLVGWCEGMAKISDPTERRDAFQGFMMALHANPQSIRSPSGDVTEAITAILFAVVSWHIPADMSSDLLSGEYAFRPFPAENAEVGQALGKLLHDLKNSVGEETWGEIEKQTPVNVRRLMREAYHI